METVQVGWRLDRDIVEQVQRLAHEEERSIGVVVRRLLRASLKSPSSPSPSNGFPPALYDNNISPPSLTPLPSPSPKINSIKTLRVDPEFDTFWQEYPRKTAKEAARKAWANARARVGAETILTGLRAARWPEDSQFIPHPSTWLNQGRWDDQPAPARPRDEDIIPL
jgi:hypothetical protein